ncbi:MAG: hypothetical protein LC104_13095 [Bacteroidales bacterium]|nr:hypothetical protein [Bacteroidales bacterium]
MTVVPNRSGLLVHLAWVRKPWTTLTGLALLAVLVLPTGSHAAPPPAEPLLRLVAPETGICVVIQNLRQHQADLTASPFADWFATSTLAPRLFPDSERARIQNFETLLQTHFEVSLADIRDEILGDAIVFAYQPGPPDRPSAESGVILVRPRKPALLERLFEKLNTVQQRSGEVQSVRTITYRDQSYTERKGRTNTEYYRVHKGIFAFSGQEAVIRSLIDRDTEAAPAPVPVGLQKLIDEKKLCAAWVNPRAFDTHLAHRASRTQDRKEAAFLEQFRKLWSACEGWAITIHPTTQLECTVAATFQQDQLPKELRPFLLPESGASAYWSAIPNDALFAVAGRSRPYDVMAALDSFLPTAGRKGLQSWVEKGLSPILGRNRFPEMVQAIGPDWAFWMEAPSVGTAAYLPGWTVAVRLSGRDPEAASALENAGELLLQLARIAYNQSHEDQIEMQQQKTATYTAHFLVNDAGFAAGFRPALARVGETLLLASSPERIASFTQPELAAPTNPMTPLLRVSFRQWRAYLTDHQDTLTRSLANWTGKSPQVLRQELQKLNVALSAFDQILVNRETTTAGRLGTVRITATLTCVKPLKP